MKRRSHEKDFVFDTVRGQVKRSYQGVTNDLFKTQGTNSENYVPRTDVLWVVRWGYGGVETRERGGCVPRDFHGLIRTKVHVGQENIESRKNIR